MVNILVRMLVRVGDLMGWIDNRSTVASRVYPNPLNHNNNFVPIGPVFRYARSVGVVSNFHYPYTMNDASRNCQWRNEHVVAKNGGYYAVEHDSELALQSAVATHGPVATSIGRRGLDKYHSGVFSSIDCGTITHGVLVVGYGTDPQHGDYWIVKNCWGFWWGEDGYFRIARKRSDMCVIASYALFPY